MKVQNNYNSYTCFFMLLSRFVVDLKVMGKIVQFRINWIKLVN